MSVSSKGGVGLLLFKASDSNLYVAEVSSTSPAGGSLQVNDCIMEIDGVPMLGSTLKHAHATVLGVPDSIVTFKVSRRKTPKPNQPVSPQSARVVSPRTGRVLPMIEPFDINDKDSVEVVVCAVTRNRPQDQPHGPAESAIKSSSSNSTVALIEQLDPLTHLDASSTNAPDITAAAVGVLPSSAFASPPPRVAGQQHRPPPPHQHEEDTKQEHKHAESIQEAVPPELEGKLQLLKSNRQVLAALREQKNAIVGERLRVQEHVWDLRRQQQSVERDCDSVAAQQRRFRDEIRRKQEQLDEKTNEVLRYKEIVHQALQEERALEAAALKLLRAPKTAASRVCSMMAFPSSDD